MSKYSRFLADKHELRLVLVLLVILIAFFFISFFVDTHFVRKGVPLPELQEPFSNLDLIAKAIYILDVRTGEVIYAKNENSRLPLASLTKLMSASLALELAPPYSTITITADAIGSNGDSGLLVGEKWSLKNLLNFSLASSSNDGIRAVALALGSLTRSNATVAERESDFINQMNKRADKLGMKNTYYFNETGLDADTNKAGAYGSASDTAHLLVDILKNHPDILESSSDGRVNIASKDGSHSILNTDPIVENIPGIKASKTGFTEISGGNLAIIFDPELGRPIVIVALGSTREGRFHDVEKLVAATLESINK